MFEKRHIPWNKGLTKRTDKRVSNYSKKVSATLEGRKLSKKTRKKMLLSNKNKNKGKHHSEKTKRKISRTLRGNVPHNKGISGVCHFSEGTKRKMSILRTGNKNPSWKGGISKLPYAFDFDVELKNLIKRRDKRTCQLCQKRKWKRNLVIHHIDYNKQNSNPKNLITLCRSCNSKVNGNRKMWTKFFVQKLKLVKIS